MGYENRMGWGCGWGGGHMFGFGLIGLVLFVAFVVLLTTRWPFGRGDQASRHNEDSALVILKERYARGEIDKTEFEIRKRDLI